MYFKLKKTLAQKGYHSANKNQKILSCLLLHQGTYHFCHLFFDGLHRLHSVKLTAWSFFPRLFYIKVPLLLCNFQVQSKRSLKSPAIILIDILTRSNLVSHQKWYFILSGGLKINCKHLLRNKVLANFYFEFL